jgi:vanillate O-demethylase monooxygenase subunit
MFLKNCWYMGGWDHEVMDGKLLERRILDQPVVFYRGESGQIVALDNRCCHRGAKLSQGRIEGDCVRCMYHGLKFDPSGKCVQIPGQDRIPPQLGVKSYPLVEKQHCMWIWMGDPALADPDEILDIPYLDDPEWTGIPAYLHYDANYLLIVDNLSDFNHLAFVHTNTLGGSEEYAYVTKPVSIDRLPNGFHVERWHKNSDPPPYLRKVIENKNDKVDRRNIARM